jgi:hypothetical protein
MPKYRITRRLLTLLVLMPIACLAGPSKVELANEAVDFKAAREAIEISSTATLAERIFVAGKLPDNSRSESLLKAMDARSKCNAVPGSTNQRGLECPSEVRSMKTLARQYAQQAWLDRDGLILGAQLLLCAASNAVSGPDLSKLSQPVRKAISNAKEGAAFFSNSDDAISQHCGNGEMLKRLLGEESSGVISSLARNYAREDAIARISKYCPGGLVRNSDSNSELNRLINLCRADGANSDQEALAALDQIEREASIRLDKDVKRLMMRFLTFKGKTITREYQVDFYRKCLDGHNTVSWDKNSPWQVQHSCYFAGAEQWYFDPLDDAEVQVSREGPLREDKMQFFGTYSTLELATRRWMWRYLHKVEIARQRLKEKCSRDAKGMNNITFAYLDMGQTFEMLCIGNNQRVWRWGFSVNEDAVVTPDPETIN